MDKTPEERIKNKNNRKISSLEYKITDSCLQAVNLLEAHNDISNKYIHSDIKLEFKRVKKAHKYLAEAINCYNEIFVLMKEMKEEPHECLKLMKEDAHD